MQLTGIERLRASKQEFFVLERASGFERGRNWALEEASYRELWRVSQLRNDKTVDREILANKMSRSGPPEEIEIGQIMERVIGVWTPSDAAVLGFIEGACEVYDAV